MKLQISKSVFVILAMVVLFASAAYADDVSLSPIPNITLSEGSSLSVTVTVTNMSATDTITVEYFQSGSSGFPTSGDLTDDGGPSGWGTTGTCTLGGISLGPGGSCTDVVIVSSFDPSASSETDDDSGLTPSYAGLFYCVDLPGVGCVGQDGTTTGFLFEAEDKFNVTVTDPVPSTSTPEPSSVILLGAGFASAGLFKRKRKQETHAIRVKN